MSIRLTQWLHSPVARESKLDVAQGAQRLGIAAIGFGLCQFQQQARHFVHSALTSRADRLDGRGHRPGKSWPQPKIWRKTDAPVISRLCERSIQWHSGVETMVEFDNVALGAVVHVAQVSQQFELGLSDQISLLFALLSTLTFVVQQQIQLCRSVKARSA